MKTEQWRRRFDFSVCQNKMILLLLAIGSIFLLVSREIISLICYHFYVIGHCLETEMSQSEKYLLWLGF